MVQTQRESVIDNLDVEQVRQIGEKIGGLPGADEFQEQVENDIWKVFTGSSAAATNKVDYQELPDKSRSIFGYVEDEEGTQFTPWWLDVFEWTARSRGEELTLEKEDEFNDDLAKLENFDPSATTIQKPQLQERNRTILEVLDAFERLFDALCERIDIEEQSNELALPSRIFEINDSSVSTTSEFQTWFNSLLEICPPVNSELTSLLMVNTGVKRDAVKDVVSPDLLEQLDLLEFPDDELFVSDYHRPIKDILALDRCFDLVVPGADRFDELGALEGLFYESWAENYDINPEVSRWIQQAADWDPESLDEGEEPIFGSIAFVSPLRLKRRKPLFTTLGLYSPNSKKSGYYEGDRGKRSEISNLMEANGHLKG